MQRTILHQNMLRLQVENRGRTRLEIPPFLNLVVQLKNGSERFCIRIVENRIFCQSRRQTVLCELQNFSMDPRECFAVCLRSKHQSLVPMAELRPIFNLNQFYLTLSVRPSPGENLQVGIAAGTALGSCAVVHCPALYPLYTGPRPIVELLLLESITMKPDQIREDVYLELGNIRDLPEPFPVITIHEHRERFRGLWFMQPVLCWDPARKLVSVKVGIMNKSQVAVILHKGAVIIAEALTAPVSSSHQQEKCSSERRTSMLGPQPAKESSTGTGTAKDSFEGSLLPQDKRIGDEDFLEFQVFPVTPVGISPSGSVKVFFESRSAKYPKNLKYTAHVRSQQELAPGLLAEPQTCTKFGNFIAIRLRNLNARLCITPALDQPLTISVVVQQKETIKLAEGIKDSPPINSPEKKSEPCEKKLIKTESTEYIEENDEESHQKHSKCQDRPNNIIMTSDPNSDGSKLLVITVPVSPSNQHEGNTTSLVAMLNPRLDQTYNESCQEGQNISPSNGSCNIINSLMGLSQLKEKSSDRSPVKMLSKAGHSLVNPGILGNKCSVPSASNLSSSLINVVSANDDSYLTHEKIPTNQDEKIPTNRYEKIPTNWDKTEQVSPVCLASSICKVENQEGNTYQITDYNPNTVEVTSTASKDSQNNMICNRNVPEPELLILKANPVASVRVQPDSMVLVPFLIDHEQKFLWGKYEKLATVEQHTFGNIVIPQQDLILNENTGVFSPKVQNIGSKSADVFQFISIAIIVNPRKAETSTVPSGADDLQPPETETDEMSSSDVSKKSNSCSMAMANITVTENATEERDQEDHDAPGHEENSDAAVEKNIVDNSVFVGNLPEGCSVGRLELLFSPISPVRNIDMKMSLKSQQHFARVEFQPPVPFAKILQARYSLGGKSLILHRWRGDSSAVSQKQLARKGTGPVNQLGLSKGTTVIENDIWIGRLPFKQGRERIKMQSGLRQVLDKFGPVTQVQVRASKGRKSCHAIVSFATKEAARTALEKKYICFTKFTGDEQRKISNYPIMARTGCDVEESSRMSEANPAGGGDIRKQIWVGNLPPLSEKVKTDLHRVFHRFGPIQNIALQRAIQDSFQPSFFAIITFDEEESVDAAVRVDPINFYGKYVLKIEKRRNAHLQPVLSGEKTDDRRGKGKE